MRFRGSIFVQDIFTTTLSRFVYISFGFISSILLARLLGPEGRGVFAAVMAIPSLISVLVDAGLRQSTVYYIGRNILPLEKVIGALSLMLFPMSVLGIIVCVAAYFYQDLTSYGWLVLGLALLWIPASILKAYTIGICMGIRKIRIVNYGEVVFSTSNLILIVFLIWSFDTGVVGAVIATASATLLQGLGMGGYIKRNYKASFHEISKLPWQLMSKGIVYALSLFLMLFIHWLDILFLTKYVEKADLGIYVVSLSLIEALIHIPHVLGMVVFSHSATSTNSDAFTLKNWKLIKFSTPLGLICGIALCFASPYFVPLLYGESYAQASYLMWYLMPGVISILPSRLIRSDIAGGRGRPELIIYVSVIVLIIKISLNFLLIPTYGNIGAAISSSGCLILFLLVIFSVYWRGYLKNSLKGKNGDKKSMYNLDCE